MPDQDSAENILRTFYIFLPSLAEKVGVNLVQSGKTNTHPLRVIKDREPEPESDNEDDEDAMDVDSKPTTNTTKGRKGTRNTTVVVSARKRGLSHKIRVTMSLAPGSSVDDLVDRIERFAAALGEVTMTLRLENRLVDGVKLSQQEINQMTRFFFQETFGSGARSRLISLVNYLGNTSAAGDTVTSGERAVALAQREDMPEDFRRFFYSLSRVSQGSRPSTSVYSKILCFWYQYRVYADFARLQRTARNHGSRYRAFLQKNGLILGVGQGSSTAIITYLATALGSERHRIRNILQQSQPIHLLACTFGPGILALIPTNSTNL